MVNKEKSDQIQGKHDLVQDRAQFEISEFEISGVDCSILTYWKIKLVGQVLTLLYHLSLSSATVHNRFFVNRHSLLVSTPQPVNAWP